MSEYSGYQRQRAHSLGPYTSVYEAKAPDGRPGRFALKIFHPPASTKVRRSYDIAGWLLAAERQQLCAKKDGAVLEVVAFGLCAEGAYAVTPWQEHPLEPIVETMAAKGDLLRALAECLLNALEQWGAQTGGSHRKLKASNIFLTRSGPLAGMTAVLTDPWFVFGAKTGPKRVNDLAALGGILAQVVRRREATAWPIEEGPEWRALGRSGKAWLAYCNYLLNPQPAPGELTLAEARKRLRALPKDSNPARMALLAGSAVAVVVVGAVLAFARFGNPIYMTDQIQRLAETVGNPRAKVTEVPREWADLCVAWDTWLIDLQGNGGRLLRTEGLWEPNDPLRKEISDFLASANDLLPATLVPESKNEKRLGVLANTPPPDVLSELLTKRVSDRVKLAGGRLVTLKSRLENWPRWDEMRTLLALLKERGFTRAAGALEPRLPPKPGSPGYKLDVVRTLKLFNEVSLDDTGTLLVASRWGEITTLKSHMEGMTEDRIQKRMPELILARLTDRSSLADFADSLANPLEEMRRYRKEYNDPAVVPERFMKESALLKETADVTTADFPRWEQELVLFSKVPAADDPRLVTSLDDTLKGLPTTAVDLEADAPAAEPGGLATLSAADFKREFDGLNASLKSLRGREIVRHDLPAISEETTKLAGVFHLMEQRLEATLALLKPEIWLAKVAQPYGKFNETKQRWAAWQATVNAVKPEDLSRDHTRFRGLRAQERQVREWIDGLEGPEGLAALVVPDLSSKATADTATALRELEISRREQTASAVGVIAEWRNALPVVPWAGAGVAVRAPLEAHRQWLSELPMFAANLDRLSVLLAGGFAWNEGVSEVMDRLARNPGLDALTGRPAEWNTEAKLLGRLVQSNDRAELIAAAQSGGLSRKFTAWRRLGTIAGWPAGAEDLDVDGAVVSDLRVTVGRDVTDDARRDTLLGELTKETRVRWNRAARNSAADEKQLTAVFERMERYGIADADLEAPALYNLNLWRLKRSDWSEVDLAPLRTRRDNFVTAVRAIAGVADQSAVTGFVDKLAAIELVVDPNRAPTPSPKMAGWHEELTDAGLGLTATWKSGGHEVKLDFLVVQPDDATTPFYLARREIAVGEFLDLIATRPKEAPAVLAELPLWTRADTSDKPRNIPLAWGPRVDNSGKYNGFELNPTWIPYTTAQVNGLLVDTDLRAQTPALDQAATEKPTLRSPLQQIPPEAAKIFAEKLLGARLPKPAEWRAALKKLGTPATGIFRGPNFQSLFNYLHDYKVAGQTTTWRPGEGAFLPLVATPGVASRRKYVDEGQAGSGRPDARLWFAPVDEGVATGGFFNLTGNVSIFLYDDAARQFYAAGGSALSPPGVDFTQPQKVEAAGLIGAKKVTEGFSDVGIRPAFDAPPGFRERYNLLVLVREQRYLTW